MGFQLQNEIQKDCRPDVIMALFPALTLKRAACNEGADAPKEPMLPWYLL
jgi:hypothetical protein